MFDLHFHLYLNWHIMITCLVLFLILLYRMDNLVVSYWSVLAIHPLIPGWEIILSLSTDIFKSLYRELKILFSDSIKAICFWSIPELPMDFVSSPFHDMFYSILFRFGCVLFPLHDYHRSRIWSYALIRCMKMVFNVRNMGASPKYSAANSLSRN